jgi:hypothetical protein
MCPSPKSAGDFGELFEAASFVMRRPVHLPTSFSQTFLDASSLVPRTSPYQANPVDRLAAHAHPRLSHLVAGRRYLLIPALVGYQAVQDLLPDILLVIGLDALLAPLLNRRKPVLEGVHIAWSAAFTLQSCHSFRPTCRDSFCHSGLVVAK